MSVFMLTDVAPLIDIGQIFQIFLKKQLGKINTNFCKVHCYKMGEGKTTYMFSISANLLSANIPFCVVPAAGEGGSGGNGTENCWH